MDRREWLTRTAGSVGAVGLSLGSLVPGTGAAAGSSASPATAAPSLPVAIQRCESYEPQVFRSALDSALKLTGGLKDLVEGKTVTIKVNLTGMTWEPVDGFPAQESYQTHPTSLAALAAALTEAGARRIAVVETLYWHGSFEEILAKAGWDVAGIQSAAAHRITFEDIRNRGNWPSYSRFKVPWGGFIFPSFDLNQRFEKTDILVSLAKLKQHACAGITGAVKNCFGNTPCAIYGNDSPSEDALLHRTSIFHNGEKQVAAGVPGEVAHHFPNNQFIRVPRITADIFGARPADLCIVDGVRTIRGGEGHWNKGVSVLEPKLLIVGRNGVCTDSVCTAAMGFDPQAASGVFPFPGDNHLALLAERGLGTNDLSQIEVRGLPLKEAVFPFAKRT